jgi:hypothetical protein
MIVATATPLAAKLMFLHCAASWSYDSVILFEKGDV